MKTKALLTMLAAFLVWMVAVPMSAQGIQFETSSYKEALAKAVKEKKMVFMDCYTSWCGPCKQLSKNVFTNDTVAAFFNKHFVCVKMDMEKGEGPALAKQFGVKAYPTLLFIDAATGEINYRKEGIQPGTQWLVYDGERAMGAKQRLMEAQKAYEADKQDSKAVLAYLGALRLGSKPQEMEKIIDGYFATLTDANRITRLNWGILGFVPDVYSPNFKYVQQYGNDFAKVIGDKKVDDKMSAWCSPVYRFIKRRRVPADQSDEKGFDRLYDILSQTKVEAASYYLALLTTAKDAQAGDYKAMLDNMEQVLPGRVFQDERRRYYFIYLNMSYLLECHDATQLDRGLKWTESLKPDAGEGEKMMQSWENLRNRLIKNKPAK